VNIFAEPTWQTGVFTLLAFLGFLLVWFGLPAFFYRLSRSWTRGRIEGQAAAYREEIRDAVRRGHLRDVLEDEDEEDGPRMR
jgi:hypothetical protein